MVAVAMAITVMVAMALGIVVVMVVVVVCRWKQRTLMTVAVINSCYCSSSGIRHEYV